MTDFITGLLALAALYWLPGAVFLRRAQIDLPSRLVGSVVVSYPAVTALTVLLGAAGVLSQLTLLLVPVVLVGAAAAFPLGAEVLDGQQADGLKAPLWAAAAVGGLAMVQALRPRLYRLFDAMTTWAPWSREIADSGDLAPAFIQTSVEGFPPSVALIAGTGSLLTGGYVETHTFLVHPLFTGLTLVTVVLLGGYFAGRSGGWIALLVVAATPLLERGMMFHDDLVVSFFTSAAVLLAIRATRPAGWALAGAAAGAALAVKHLGVVAVLLGAVVLFTRRPSWQSWLAAAAAWLVGLPWYLWNVARFGNPVYPMFSGFFGESPEVVRVVTARDANLQAVGRGALSEIGLLALAAVLTGVVAAFLRAKRERNPIMLRFSSSLAAAVALYLVVWETSGYATRHVLIVLPAVAALAGYGLGGQSRDTDPFWRRHLAPLVGIAVLAVFTVSSILVDVAGDDEPGEALQTGVYTLLAGKSGLEEIVSPPTELSEMYGNSGVAWELLTNSDPEPLVLSVDGRTYYYPQQTLVGLDVRALAIFDGANPVSRHAAAIEAGVGYVIDNRLLRSRRSDDLLAANAFWRDVRRRPLLYEEIFAGGSIVLYRVLPPN